MIQKKKKGGSVFRTTMESPAIFKEELPAPRATLVKAGWCNIRCA